MRKITLTKDQMDQLDGFLNLAKEQIGDLNAVLGEIEGMTGAYLIGWDDEVIDSIESGGINAKQLVEYLEVYG